MPTVEQLIHIKTERLESVPDALLSKIERVQKKVLPQVLELMMLLDKNSAGMIELTDKNIQLLSTIQSKLRDVLIGSEYSDIVHDFVDQFEVQKGVSDELFKSTFADFISDGKASKLVKLSQKSAADLFINGITDEAFADAIYKQLDLAISNNASFAETVRNIQTIVTGDDEKDGKILQYAKQVAHDQFALSDRSYTSAVSTDLKAEWFLYAGHIIKTSREFCVERHNQYFYYKELEFWGEGKRTEGMEWPQSGTWPGEIPGTNAQTIFTTLGGFNCAHTPIPVSIAIVPKSVIQRNINQGFFIPSQFEQEELGL